MELTGRKVAVIGLARTGLAVMGFLSRRGARVLVTDETPLEKLPKAAEVLRGLGSAVEWVPYLPEAVINVDLVVPSPGVPPRNPLLIVAKERGIPVWSEIELAYRFLKTPAIAITGTNGKTTTTTLTGQILAHCGKKVFVGGNIGNPLIEYIEGDQDADYAVLEVSSFQLQWTESFRPRVAVHLNTTCDHVDYHGSFAAYRAAKERIFAKQGKEDRAVLNAEDPGTKSLEEQIASSVVLFSSRRPLPGRGIYREGDSLVLSVEGYERETYPLSCIRLPGLHNLENVMAAIGATRFCGCLREGIIDAVASFHGIPHRIEFVDRVAGVSFYDDSKGTNVDAVRRALESFDTPVVLLMGGRDKEGDFESMEGIVRERVKVLVLFGEARERIGKKIGGTVTTVSVSSLGEAVGEAFRHAVAGDVVLLSPGCASFDAFRDYKERGDFFKAAVRELQRHVQ